MQLITSIGTNKDLILQYFDFFNRDDLEYSPDAMKIKEIFKGKYIDSIFLFHTEEEQVKKAIDELSDELAKYSQQITIMIESLKVDDIKTSSDNIKARDIVFVNFGKFSHPQTIISSAGRKTITNHILEAGLLYGCKGYLSITAPHGKEGRKHTKEFSIIWTPISSFVRRKKRLLSSDEDTSLACRNRAHVYDNFRCLDLFPLLTKINFNLYRIDKKSEFIKNDLEFIKQLPKADIHCHLGGQVNPDFLKKTAEIIIQECQLDKNSVIKTIQNLLECEINKLNHEYLTKWTKKQTQREEFDNHCLKGLDSLYELVICEHDELKEYQVNACFLSALTQEQINDLIWGEFGDFKNVGLKKYMQAGNFGGSKLLQTKKAIVFALENLMQEAKEENVLYLEVRCSPVNYTKDGLHENDVMETLIKTADNFMKTHDNFYVRFIISGTRHKNYDILTRHVDIAVKYSGYKKERILKKSIAIMQPLDANDVTMVFPNIKKSCVCGFDLAGSETGFDIQELKEKLSPIYENFIPVTIHAGEMEESKKIWQALYTFHALRIGHGLKLINNKTMMQYIRDAQISIEMCPSSNMQTNLFRDWTNESHINEQYEAYPLKTYMENDITVTINTDNRGISRTTLSEEYLNAANLTENGLSIMEILYLIRNGFRSCFLPIDEKNRLLGDADKLLFDLIMKRHYE
jgi:adenosine deaminase